MYGNNIGSLNVYRQTYGLFQNSVWSKSGNHGYSWFKAQIDVNGVIYNYKVGDFICEIKMFHQNIP